MTLTPNSWGSPVAERWSDEARRRSAEVRRAKAMARRKFAEEYGIKWGSKPQHRLAGVIDADTQRAHDVFKAQTMAGPLVTRDHVDFKKAGLLDDNPRVVGEPKIYIGTDQPRADALSALRHEVGHLDVGWAQRGRPYKIAGKNVSHRYAEEFAAWKAAVRDAPLNRVRWSRVENALFSYRKADLGKDYTEQEIHRLVQRDVAVLKRYGRRLRRHDTTPEGV